MSIIWKYLDKRAATIDAIRDYSSMEFIIENTDEKIRAEHDKMSGLSSPMYSDMPSGGHNDTAAEDRIIDGIEKIDVLKERYRQAKEYMDWFQPSWDKLSEEEQDVLRIFYRDNEYGGNPVNIIADKFKIEQTSAYKKKNRALDHMVVLLYGKD